MILRMIVRKNSFEEIETSSANEELFELRDRLTVAAHSIKEIVNKVNRWNYQLSPAPPSSVLLDVDGTINSTTSITVNGVPVQVGAGEDPVAMAIALG